MSNNDKQTLRDIAEKTKIAGEAPVMPFEQRINALNDFMKHFTPATALALLDELEALQSFRTAFNEWHDKTEWVQGDKRFDVIKPWGKHRADVLKLYIDHLESKLEAAEKRNAELVHNHRVHAARLIDERGQLKQRIAELREWNAGLAQESCIQQQRIAKLEEKLQTADKLQDSAFRHGLQHGFSLGQTDNQAGFEECLSAYGSRGKDNG
ncbi:ead/Ea22-like family protein [Citrobacter koseri]